MSTRTPHPLRRALTPPHRPVLQGAVRYATLAALFTLLAGCTSLTSVQEARLADWQKFANRVTTHYRTSDVTFLVGTQSGPGAGAMRPGGLMTLSPNTLDALGPGQSRDFLLAHELAHWVLGHGAAAPPNETNASEWQRDQEARELEANAEAVKILMIGRGWSERKAFFHAHSYLWSYRRGVAARRYGVPAGHPSDPCVEINDLIRHYPQYPHISEPCPSWPEPRWAMTAAELDARSRTRPDASP
jgi:IrrE N-terminal-like domain